MPDGRDPVEYQPVSAALIARDIGVLQGSVPVLAGVSLSVHPGSRWAVVGPNGVGKTTLLKVLAGELAPDEGWVRAQPLSAVVVHVAQELLICPGETVLGYLARSSGVAAREQATNVAAQALADAESRAVGDAYDAALQDWLAAGGADFAERTAEVGDRLGCGST
ncbi:MAG: ATP-binding cassette domain-containing protein [Geodermatophilaceae bacterium]